MTGSKNSKDRESQDLLEYYTKFDEGSRLVSGIGPLELARTQEILLRFLPLPPAVILDVGGGSGVYSFWLARKGYEVHLIDPVSQHVERAKVISKKQSTHPLASIRLGDARDLDHSDSSVDAVLSFGPLYHLTDPEARIKTLREARRVMRKGGILFAALISRFASLMDGHFRGFLEDPAFRVIVEQDLTDGQHRNPTDKPEYFTSSFFHLPEEIKVEVKKSGLVFERLLPVESFGAFIPHFEEFWRETKRRQRLLGFIRKIENESSLLGVSPHLITIARKP